MLLCLTRQCALATWHNWTSGSAAISQLLQSRKSKNRGFIAKVRPETHRMSSDEKATSRVRTSNGLLLAAVVKPHKPTASVTRWLKVALGVNVSMAFNKSSICHSGSISGHHCSRDSTGRMQTGAQTASSRSSITNLPEMWALILQCSLQQ